MRRMFLLVMLMSLGLLAVALLPEVLAFRREVEGVGRFVPSALLIGASVALILLDVAVAVWVWPKIRIRDKVRGLLDDEAPLWLVQRTSSLAQILSDLRPPVLITLSASREGLRFWKSPEQSRLVPASEIAAVGIDPRGYQSSIPTVKITFQGGHPNREFDFVVSRAGLEVIAEKRLPAVEKMAASLRDALGGKQAGQ